MGSVYQRRSDNKWVASVWIDQRRVTRYATTEKSARKLLNELEALKLAGQAPAAPKTINQLLERWIAAEQEQWRPKTKHEYQRLLDLHVRPTIGTIKLNRLQPDRLQRLVDGVPGAKQKVNVFRVLRRVMNVAVRWGWLPSNPCDRLAPPKYQAGRPSLPEARQLACWLDALANDPWGPWIIAAVHTGLRYGEQAALRWEDVDLKIGTVTVARAVQRINGEWVFGTPKTRAGVRCIHIGSQAIQALKRQRSLVAERRLQVGEPWQDGDLVFPGEYGQPLAQNTVGKAISRLCEHHGLTRLTPHKLRHLSASLLFSQGAPVPDISRRLGHSSAAVTLSVYAHAVGEDRALVDVLSRALG